MTNRTRVVVQDRTDGPIELRELVLPDPTGHEVLVRMHATGMCQSQIFWMHAPHADPMLFGHEGYGTVVKTGPDVTTVVEGDRVLVTLLPRVADRYPDRAGIALPSGARALSPNVYTWADLAVVDELYTVTLAPENHKDVTSIVGCAVVTGAGAVINIAPVQAGQTVAVIGVGGVGLCAVAAAAIRGAARVIAIDLDEEKLRFARRFGATDVVDARGQEPVAAVRELTDGGVDIAVDVVSTPGTFEQATSMIRSGAMGIRRGGTVVVIGAPKLPVSLDLGAVMSGQLSIVGTMGGGCSQEDIATFLAWQREGRLDVDALVTDRYPLDQVGHAVEELAGGRVLGRVLLTM